VPYVLSLIPGLVSSDVSVEPGVLRFSSLLNRWKRVRETQRKDIGHLEGLEISGLCVGEDRGGKACLCKINKDKLFLIY